MNYGPSRITILNTMPTSQNNEIRNTNLLIVKQKVNTPMIIVVDV